MNTPRMLINRTSATATDVLAYALKARPDLPVTGWEHYLTGMADDGTGTFHYDRPDENGQISHAIQVRCHGSHRLVTVEDL